MGTRQGPEATAEAKRETTVEELLEQVRRIAASEPHARCHEGTGPLAPLAVALNTLSNQLSVGRMKMEDAFGIQALFEQSPNSMFTCDLDSRIRFINFTVPGITVAQVLGQNLYDWIHEETRERVRASIQKVLETGEPEGFEARPVVEGGPEWFAGRVGPIKVGDTLVGFTVILADITELKRTQRRLEQSNRELESFAYVASHDLQEPLRKIHTFGDRLKKIATDLNAEGRDHVDRMQAAAVRMRQLIDDLLTFSRVSVKGRPFTQVDLAAITREVLEDLESQLERSGAEVTVGELPVLEADPLQMRQLLQNLLGNALKFHREGVRPSILVRGSTDTRAGRCELVVEDNGIGFDEKYSERIFNVFQRLHGRGQYEGTGIGLAICRKIAERHGGRISARSVLGQGSTFSTTLPLKQPFHG